MSDLFGTPKRPEACLDDMYSPERVAKELEKTLAYITDRDSEALLMYEPMELQAPIHECRAKNVLVTGGNQSGKTLACCVEDARCVTNQDPYKKYPDNGLMVIIGYGWKHIGSVFYPTMFKPGAFQLIIDQKTKKYRSWRPWEPEDKARRSETIPAPPLIPKRFIKDIAWEQKNQDQFVRVTLSTGWEIWAYSSEADSQGMQGFRVDRVHIDEDLDKESWVSEAQARTIMREGCLWWSAMPQCKSDARMTMSGKAEEHRDEENPLFVEFRLPFTSNKFISEETKKQKMEEWAAAGDDILRMRAYGEYTFNDSLMYPQYGLELHGLKIGELEGRQVPDNWTRFVAIDPGYEVCAAVFGAVPPKGDMLLIYDELYIKYCNAELFGNGMETKCKGHDFYAFIIDMHGARLRDIGGGRNVLEQYRAALDKRKIECEACGSGFLPGSDQWIKRSEAVRLRMRPDATGKPNLRFLTNDDGSTLTPNLHRALVHDYRRKKDAKTGIVMDEPVTRGNVHSAQSLEYLMAYNPIYHKPKGQIKEAPWARVRTWFDKWGEKAEPGEPYVFLGPRSMQKETV